jgi:hypothetical protein
MPTSRRLLPFPRRTSTAPTGVRVALGQRERFADPQPARHRTTISARRRAPSGPAPPVRDYVLLTENVADFVTIAAEHSTTGARHPGVMIALSNRFSRRPAGQAALVKAIRAHETDEITDRIVHLTAPQRAPNLAIARRLAPALRRMQEGEAGGAPGMALSYAVLPHPARLGCGPVVKSPFIHRLAQAEVTSVGGRAETYWCRA